MDDRVTLNKYGYYELAVKPTEFELEQYYAKKYYQEDKSSYSKSYSEEEVKYILNKIEQKYKVIADMSPSGRKNRSFLDVGCGEGWALQFFYRKGWRVSGLDFSDFGCVTHNPHLKDFLIVGDLYRNLKGLGDSGNTYDVIWLDNILEHVLDPLSLLRDCRKLLSPGGVMVIEVPNDFSIVQKKLLENKMIDRLFWIAIPDHISYFNKDGLIRLCNEAGWNVNKMLTDFPIDLNLFNPNTNYVLDRSKGPSCHQVRVELENMLHDISLDQTIKLYEVLAEMGLGRQITGFFTREEKGGNP